MTHTTNAKYEQWSHIIERFSKKVLGYGIVCGKT